MARFRVLLGSVVACVSLAACNGGWLEVTQGGRSAAPATATADPFARGKAHYAEGNFGLALQSFQAAIAANGDSVETLNAIAATYDQLGRYDIATMYYKRAMEIDPKSAQTLNNMGYSLVMQRRYDEALRYFQLARAGDDGQPATVGANVKLAQDLIAKERQQEAAPAAQPGLPLQIAQAAPEESPVWVERTAPGVHTLVTRPEPETLMRIVQQDVDPRLAHVSGGVLPTALVAGGEVRAALPPVAPAAQPAVLRAPLPPAAKPARPLPTLAIEVSNGAGREGMARRFREYLAQRGFDNMRLTNDASFANRKTVVFYRQGYLSAAQALVQHLPQAVPLVRADTQAVQVRLRLGGDYLDFDRRRLLTRTAFDEDVAG
jgi:hypothetical protein